MGNKPNKHTDNKNMDNKMDRAKASMVLSGVGDALGYRNGEWEFCYKGVLIHEQLNQLGGVSNIEVDLKKWRVSDDTVMHIATAQALVSDWSSKQQLFLALADEYQKGMKDMWGRAPGGTTQSSCGKLCPDKPDGYIIPFDSHGGGCGAGMRSMCIGLLFHEPQHLEDLIEVSVESGRITHNHPTGYLGSLAAALFTSYAMQNKPVREWGKGLMETLSKARDYVKKVGRDCDKNEENWSYFTDKWNSYLKLRGIENGDKDPTFPEAFSVEDRDKFYSSVSYSGWGGASGHDAPMIAYDALMGAGDSWEELCHRGMFHGGDNDSTGVMAGAWYGAIHGLDGVPLGNYQNLEYRQRLEDLGQKLFQKSQTLE